MKEEDTVFDRRAEDKIPSAHKLWIQKALDEMRPSPQMIEEIKKAVSEANEVLIHKLNNSIQVKTAELQLEIERHKTQEKISQGNMDARMTSLESESKTLKWVFGLSVTALIGIATVVVALVK